MNKPIRLLAGFFTVGGWTLLSRIAGFARDIMIAAFFGSGPIAEAFQIAFSLPNMFRRFFAEGAFNMAFVPMFSKKLESGDGPEEFAREAFGGLASILIVFTLLATIFMPALVWLMASGFMGDQRFDIAVDFGRICFPYILFISLAALCSGVLNSMGRFAAAAAAPVLLNIILVGAMVVAYLQGWDVARALVWGVPFAGLAQLGLVFFAAKRAGMNLAPRMPRLSPDMKRLAIIAAPAALAGGVLQVNLLVGRQVASQTEGAIQWLAVADRLYQLPLGLVGIAIGIVLLPDLSRKLQAGDGQGGQDAFNRAVEFSLMLTLPAAAALMVMPWALISVLFERGAFSPSDSNAAAAALAIYGAGLPAFVLQKAYQPLFFAREDTRSPLNYALVAMILNAVIAIGLYFAIGYLAAALATTLAAWLMLALLANGARKMGDAAVWDSRLKQKIRGILIATGIFAVILGYAAHQFSDLLATNGLRYAALFAIVLFGIIFYGGLLVILGTLSRNSFRDFLGKN